MMFMRFRFVDCLLLFFVLATAAGARVGYLVHYADGARNAGPLQVDDGSLTEAAAPSLTENLCAHRWFGCLAPFAAGEERTAHVAPGYAWLCGDLGRLPPTPQPADSLIRWIHTCLGTLTAGIYFLFARGAFRSRTVAVLSGLFGALDPSWVISTAALTDGVLVSFLLAGCLWLGNRGGQAGGALTALLFGLALAALALTRAALLPFAWIVLLWFLWRCRRRDHGAMNALLAFLGFLTGLAPWTMRNFEVFGDVFPVVNSTYLHVWIGNNPRATGGPLTEREMIAALAESSGETPGEAARRLASQPDQAQRYRMLADPALDEIRQNPAGTLNRRLAAGLGFFFGEDWLTQRRLWRDNADAADSESAFPGQFYHALLTGSLLAMLLLAALGWRWSFAMRREAMPLSLALIWIPLPYLLSHAEALSGPRLPLDGVLGCYAAFAVGCLLPRLRTGLLNHASTRRR